jgi:SAM-dependent methyltransferase
MLQLLASLMQRSIATEIMDDTQMPEEVWERFHKELTAIHHILGDIRAIESAIEHDTVPVRRVLDLGCGSGRMLGYLRKSLGIEVVGIDMRIPKIRTNGVEFIQANAITTKLPKSDVAIALGLIHHLTDFEVIDLIHNVARSSRRLMILDPVRHAFPLLLFRSFVTPFLHPVTAADGCQSIRRAYTSESLKKLISQALEGGLGTFSIHVAPLWIRQTVDIRFSET